MMRKENLAAIAISILIVSSIIIYAMAQQLFITTDKPTYTAGDTIIVSGYGPADAILIMMVYLTNKTLYLDQLSLGDNGNFTLTLPTFTIEATGTHTVWIAGKAYSNGELVAETTTSFLYIVPGAETNTTTTNTTTELPTVTVTETTTVTETQTETITETLISTTTITTTQTVTETTTQTETTTETVTETTTETQTVTTTQIQTQTVTQTNTETTTVTQTNTVTETTTQLQPTTITQTITAPAPLAEKIVYLIVGLFVGVAITYAMRVLTTKQQ